MHCIERFGYKRDVFQRVSETFVELIMQDFTYAILFIYDR